jgi:hypothetical protein
MTQRAHGGRAHSRRFSRMFAERVKEKASPTISGTHHGSDPTPGAPKACAI